MLKLLARRVLALIPTMLLATFVVFGLLQLVPGDPAVAIAGEYATEERIREIREDLGLNDPFLVQYASWLGDAVTLDFGSSLHSGGPVAEQVFRRFPATLTVVAGALILAVVVGVPLGIAAALRADTKGDSLITGVSTLGIAVPNFWLGMILVSVFALRLGWLPATGSVGITENFGEAVRYAILPSVALGAVGAAEITRQLRSSMLGVLHADYIRTHRAKGLRSRAIIWKHALKNAGIPLVTVVGLLVNRFLGATVVVEAVFGIAGVGSMVVEATNQKDFPVIQGVVLAMVILILVTNLVVDLAYRLIDPRIRL